MDGFTYREAKKVKEITHRLERIYSPVLRLQAIMQFSQIVDILSLGDTNAEVDHREIRDWEEPEGYEIDLDVDLHKDKDE